jgi:3-oxoadipate enol-lactonase/4-carboxymuconolactone decarboxylase
MPDLLLPRSPLAAAGRPARIHYREAGRGPAVLLLHGGWGYEAYPYDAAFSSLSPRHRVVAPDRTGYGRSGPLADGALPRGFHVAMAEETLLLMDALGLERAALWGHSDGAVVAAWLAILAPGRVSAVVLEALHFLAAKVSSIDFFETAVAAPERFGPQVVAALERDHGARWRDVVGAGGRAWLDIIAEGRAGKPDLYDGRFGEIVAPALLLHGRRDPRTEPGELDLALRALPSARLELVDASHSPHTSTADGARANELATRFLDDHAGALPSGPP